MPDWITNIGISAAGLPWWAVFVLMAVAGIARELIPALLKVLGFTFEREKYKDGLKAMEHDALVKELKDRIDKLENLVTDLQREGREDRLNAARLLAEEKTAHSKCQIEQEQLRGDLRVHSERMNTMQVQLDRLLSHDKANTEHTKKLAEIVKAETGKAPEIV